MGAMEAFLEAVRHLRAHYFYAGAIGAGVLMLVLGPLYPAGHPAQPWLILALVAFLMAGAAKSVEWALGKLAERRARKERWKAILTTDHLEAGVLVEALERGTRTFHRPHGNLTGWALVQKGLAEYAGPENPKSTGAFMVPFTIRPAVWDLMVERKDLVLQLRDTKADAKVGYT